MANPEEPETIGVFRGVIQPPDRVMLTNLAARLGLTAEFLTPDEFDNRTGQEPAVGSASADSPVVIPNSHLAITSPDQFVGREHFEEFKEEALPDMPRQSLGRAFNHLIDCRTADEIRAQREWVGRHSYDTGVPIHFPGLIIVPREQAGFRARPAIRGSSERSRQLADYVIQAGSLVAVRPVFRSESFPIPSVKPFLDAFTRQLANQMIAKT